jgi:hypothetical protein
VANGAMLAKSLDEVGIVDIRCVLPAIFGASGRELGNNGA